MCCKRMYVNGRFPLAGGLIKQTTAAADWSVRLQRTDRSQRVRNIDYDCPSQILLTRHDL